MPPLLTFSFSFRQAASLLVVLLTSLLVQPLARAQAWQAAVSFAPSPNITNVTATATDALGNVYVTGYFAASTATFGSITLTSAGSGDAFLAKWSPATSSFVWARNVGGSGFDAAIGLTSSGSNIYLVGYFSGTASFGGTTLASVGSTDGFVVKLTDAGSIVWARSSGVSGGDEFNAVAANGANVYVASGGNNVSVSKFTDSGTSATPVWSQQSTISTNARVANSMAVNGNNIYITGAFSSPTVSFGTTLLANGGSPSPTDGSIPEDIFVAKLTDAGASGSFTWAQRAGSPSFDRPSGLAISGGNVYVVGSFTGPATFGTTTLTSVGGTFVSKLVDLGGTGSYTWTQSSGGGANAVAVSGSNVYVAGQFTGTANFGTTTLTTTGPGSNIDLYVTKLTDAGPSASFAWAQSAGNNGSDSAFGVAVNGSNVYVAGTFTNGSVSFGSLPPISGVGGSGGGFLASIQDGAALSSATATELSGSSLWPNPAREQALVRIPAVSGTSAATLTLTDALGRVLRTQVVALPASTSVSLLNLPPALYTLRVQAGERWATHKLVVE
ncbi:T9SS type A sorting domain-containing protein [Hymenobacter terrenus]|uniref:T9SS type A sorting domain-containing protein n=1 Tax=Hymenobacter terrenus TaxID=1629124 RepID=UPI000619E977|nr:T9SS type A sorting domain-containing protein [Hymenobacter terrenus]